MPALAMNKGEKGTRAKNGGRGRPEAWINRLARTRPSSKLNKERKSTFCWREPETEFMCTGEENECRPGPGTKYSDAEEDCEKGPKTQETGNPGKYKAPSVQ